MRQHVVQYGTDQEVWVESLDTVEEKKIGIRKLNADVFSGTVQYSTGVFQYNTKKAFIKKKKNDKFLMKIKIY